MQKKYLDNKAQFHNIEYQYSKVAFDYFEIDNRQKIKIMESAKFRLPCIKKFYEEKVTYKYID